MIFNIRGTNGSGKTTLVRQLMESTSPKPFHEHSPKTLRLPKVLGYRLMGPRSITVIGSYENVCGGCDGIHTQQEAKDRIVDAHQHGDVVFEGVLISTIFGPWLDFSRANGGMVWAFLDTPLQTCLDRIQLRNGGKPVKEDQVKGKWDGMRRIAEKAEAAGENVVWIPHLAALPAMLSTIDQFRQRKAA